MSNGEVVHSRESADQLAPSGDRFSIVVVLPRDILIISPELHFQSLNNH
jgi:hypothetical protein